MSKERESTVAGGQTVEPVAFVGGSVLTPAGRLQRDAGVYLQDGLIRAVGTADEIREALPQGAEVIHLDGGTVVPGFIDAHCHPLSLGSSLRMIDARYPAVSSVQDLVAKVAAKVTTVSSGSWVRGRGLDHDKFPDGRVPTRWDLDPVSPQNPVAMVHISGHFALVNSVALELAGVTDSEPDPQGGRLVRDGAGHLTGMLLDTAMQRVLPSAVDVGTHAPSHNTYPAPVDELVDDLVAVQRLLLEAGVTTVVDAQVTSRDMAAYLEARRRGALRVRFMCMYLSNHLDELLALGLATGLGDSWLSIGPLKVYSDGALSGGTAAFTEGYQNDPADHGKSFWTQEELATIVGRAHRGGFQVGIHAQGDQAIEMCLNAFERALVESPRADHRHRLEHCGAPTRRQLERIRALGLIPVCQPRFIYELGENFIGSLGLERAAALMPLRTEFEMGIPTALSSDAAVASYRPLDNIQAAVERRTMRGKDLGRNERIEVLQAIRGYTWNSAHSLFREDELGSLEPNKAADLVVLGADLTEVPPTEISKIPIRYTIVGGRVEYPFET